MSLLSRMVGARPALLQWQKAMFGANKDQVPTQVFRDLNANKYQESRMLFFGNKNLDSKVGQRAARPKTIGEIKKLQNFVRAEKTEPGKSLNASVKGLAQRNPEFNDFLRNFKAKNEQNWASIVDMTQDSQEMELLAKSPEYRKNEMIMLEEFRRRKKHKDWFDINKKNHQLLAKDFKQKLPWSDGDFAARELDSVYEETGPERYFEPRSTEVFDPQDFTMMFLDADSTTNVTSLNRVNKRRILFFIGNGNGLISFGKGKGDDYESAFDNAFKKMRFNMVCLSIDRDMTFPKILQGRHNDFKIKIWPNHSGPHYWGNPQMWKLLLHSGFHNVRYQCISREQEPYSMLYAYFNCVTQNQTLADISQLQGTKLHVVSYGNKAAAPKRDTSNNPMMK